MKIERADVVYAAQLANLEVAPEEQEALAAQLSRIVEYVEQLNALPTADVPPTAQITARRGPADRPDQVAAREGSGEAADTVGLFRVPRVIQER